MKINFSFIAAIMTVAAISFVGCGGDGPEPNPGPGPGPVGGTFEIKTSNVTATTVDVDVIASDEEMPYLVSYFDDEDFEKYGSDEKIQGFVDALLEELQKSEQGKDMTIEEIVEAIAQVGSIEDNRMAYLDPATNYYLFAIGMNLDGTVSSKLAIQKVTMLAASGEAPTMTLEAKPGHPETGANPSSILSFGIKTTIASYGRIGLFTKESVDQVITEGGTLEWIISNYGENIQSEHLTEMNGDGMTFFYEKLPANTAFTYIQQIVSTGGRYEIKSISATTAASDAAPQMVSLRQGQMSSVVKNTGVVSQIKGIRQLNGSIRLR